MRSERVCRVLHVVGRMDRGGVETWLMHVLRSIDRARFALDFLVHTDMPGAHDEEIRRLGGRVIPLPLPTQRFWYASRFRRAIRDHGPYDIVHSHVHHFSGVVLRAAYLAGIGSRIAHSHSDTSAAQATATITRRAYLRVTEALIRRYGTTALAASEKAGRALFTWDHDDSRCAWDVLHYGIDLDPFLARPDKVSVRRELGLDSDTLIVGHVGNFNAVKNHAFLVSVFEEITKRHRQSALLLVGEGPLRKDLETQIAARGLRQRVIFAGPRSDVPRVLAGAVDVFVFPSLWEGLPVAVIEAQAAGLPVLLSDRVSNEVVILPHLVHRLPLEAGPAHWATVSLQVRLDRMMPEIARRQVADSDMNIQRCVSRLQETYEANMRKGGRHCAA
jgi:glycosyltransferase involved in cell wall biosynthesis